jgi:hypothetical protein
MTFELMTNIFSCEEFRLVYSPYEKITTYLNNVTKKADEFKKFI